MNIKRAIILIILQVSLFIFIHNGTVKLYDQFVDTSKVDISWGISLTVAVWLFAFISIAINLLSESVFKKRKLIILLIGLLIFGAFHIQQITFRPYRTLILLVSAFIALAMPFLVTRKYLKNAAF